MGHPGIGEGSAWASCSHGFRAAFVATCAARGWEAAELYAAMHMLSDGTMSPTAGSEEWDPYGRSPCSRVGLLATPEDLARSAIARVPPLPIPPDELMGLRDRVPEGSEWATWHLLRMTDWEQLAISERILVRVERDGGFQRPVDYVLAGLGIWHEAQPETVVARHEEPGYHRLRRLVRVPADSEVVTVADLATEVEARLQASIRLSRRPHHGR